MILVDLLYLKTEQNLIEGVGIYAIRILEGLRHEGFVGELTLLVTAEISPLFKAMFPEIPQIVIPRKNKHQPSKLSTIKKIIFLATHLRRNHYDVLYMPFGNGNRFRFEIFLFWFVKRRAVTVHDLYMFTADYLRKHPFRSRLFARRLSRSTCIIAISDFTKQTILKRYPAINSEKIRVVHNSIENFRLLPAGRQSPPVSGTYILSVNALLEKKNQITLLRAFAEIKDRVGHRLVLVGKPTEYWYDILEPFIQTNDLTDRVVHLSMVEKNDLISLYRNASLFVTTSLREGFGFTPIEAAVCGAPVVSSRADALYETTRGLFEYYDPPEDHKALAGKITSVLEFPPTGERRREIADSLLASYDINRQSREVINVIRSCRA